MQPSDDPKETPGQGLAILAEALYVSNLLVLPVFSFLALAWLFMRCDKDTPILATAHINQTFAASLWAGVLLVLVNLMIVALGGYDGIHTWTLVILYFTMFHSAFVLLGILGLAKAMAGQCWRFPIIGPRLPHNCEDTCVHDHKD